jgi:hypothetical protein
MQDNVNIIHGRASDLGVAHVGLYELNFIQDRREVTLLAGQQIIDDPHKATLGHELAADV